MHHSLKPAGWWNAVDGRLRWHASVVKILGQKSSGLGYFDLTTVDLVNLNSRDFERFVGGKNSNAESQDANAQAHSERTLHFLASLIISCHAGILAIDVSVKSRFPLIVSPHSSCPAPRMVENAGFIDLSSPPPSPCLSSSLSF